ncbi:V-set and transmembrane domain-containing protein 1-like isoform X2 [Suricata suricatta]|uniref:V-set and transmembrane domain-containing protein 1-like isoform X2 n=1 Tax=Suricata suricatta TaxID=37032 RepID=UPI001155E1CD|nr:V-set and transmembrane domain-containing protein 1-like isoform X2 [Suricata suricatta]
MITEFLSLLCLGLSMGFEDEKKNETLTKPYLSALPSPVVEWGGNVTLRCQGHFQNVTFMLGKLQDSGYREEQRSAGHTAEFFLTNLEPKDSGTYFCAYKTMASQEWSEQSEHLQLEVTDDRGKHRAPPAGKASGSVIAATCSCLSIVILFLSIFFINRCTQDGSSHEESTKRSSDPIL